MKHLTRSATLLSLTLALASCGTSTPTPGNTTPGNTIPGNTTPRDTAPVEPIIRPEARIPDAQSRAALTTFQKLPSNGKRAMYEMRYQSTPFTEAIQPGNVLVSEPGPNAPYGYLVKVTNVKREGGVIIVQAEQGRITDAVARGRIDLQQALKPEKLAKQTLAPGVQLATSSAAGQGHLSAQSDDPLVDWQKTYGYSVSLNKVLYDIDGDEKTLDDQTGSKGNFYFNLGLDFMLDVNWFDLDFRAKVDVDQGTNLQLYARGKYEFKKEFKLSELQFSPITVPIGPVTVVIVPVVTLYLDASGKIQGEVNYALQQTLKASAGVEYIDEFKNLSSGPDWTFKHSGIQASASAEAQVGPRVRLAMLLYGVAGAYGEARAYANFKAQYPAKPLWKLDLCGAGNVGVEADLFFDEFSYSAEVFKKCKSIAEAQNAAPIINSLTAKRDNVVFGGNPNDPFTTSDDIKVCATAKDPENDPFTLRFTAEDGLDKLGGDDDCTVHQFKTVGDHPVTVTARDLDGATSTKTITVKIGKAMGPAPVVTIVSPVQNEKMYLNGVNGTKTLSGYSDLGDCAKEKWTSSVASDVLPTNNCGLPTITYSATGARTLTLTATSATGAVGKASVAVTVEPKPADNLFPVISLKMKPSTTIVNNEKVTVTYSLSDANDDEVTYSLRVYPKGKMNEAKTLDEGKVGNTLKGVNMTKEFHLSDLGGYGACPKGDFVLEFSAYDQFLSFPFPMKTVAFTAQCIK
ncbi:PKD domain-containing protein [Deinococcus hopiensis]|uniref:PKD/Chitinase domain-containing protein n=1 Tax=Deinococcus hopiensis KR-140 TaxID=695939 RepID=A0A1W1UBA9_9DEIO|nr:PKD domain-containing protein [Deinococcus hopiensis]SMB78322.1 hypothetical protein SAMN00790413_06602 [Deinococcus hopiensis KR-140]